MQIKTKEEILNGLESSFSNILAWIEEQPIDKINKEIIEGKWTIAGHYVHLIKSARAVTRGLKMPRIGLRGMFGVNNREERTFDGLREKYEAAIAPGITAGPDFIAKPGKVYEKEDLIKQIKEELDQFKSIVPKWSEKDLSKYIVPHPAIGKVTLREILFFTIFHTDIHLNTLKTKYEV